MMSSISQSLSSILDVTISHPFSGVAIAAAALLLLARPGKSSYRV